MITTKVNINAPHACWGAREFVICLVLLPLSFLCLLPLSANSWETPSSAFPYLGVLVQSLQEVGTRAGQCLFSLPELGTR